MKAEWDFYAKLLRSDAKWMNPVVGRILLKLAEAGVDISPVIPVIEALDVDFTKGGPEGRNPHCDSLKALSAHRRNMGEEKALTLHRGFKSAGRTASVHHRRHYGRKDKGWPAKHIRWAKCGGCLSKQVRLLFFDDDVGWASDQRLWEFRCKRCGRYTVFSNSQ